MHRVFPVLMLALGFTVGGSIAVAYSAGAINFDGDVVVGGAVTIQDGTQGVGKVFTSDSVGKGSWETSPDTNAATLCAAGEFLNGDGTCDPVPVVPSSSRFTQCDTNTDGGIDNAEFLYWLLMNGVSETIDGLTTPTTFADDVEAGATSSNFNGVVDTTDELAFANFILTVTDSTFPVCKVF